MSSTSHFCGGSLKQGLSRSSFSQISESSMATAEVKEEQEVYVWLPLFYDEGKHILSWALSHFPNDETKIVVTVIVCRQIVIGIDRAVVNKTRDKHLAQCAIHKFNAEGLIMYQNYDEVQGILKLIDLRAIKNLVMELNPNSEMLASVVKKANPSCKIWVIYKGNIHFTRYPKSDCTEATSEERIRRKILHQKEIEEIQKRENDKNDLLKRENKQLKLEIQLLRNQQHDNLIQLKDLDMQKQQLEKNISDLEIDYNKLMQECDNAIKEAEELRKQKEHSFASSDLVLSSQFSLSKLEYVPSHFICPIMQEIMKNPCIAADGYTYEAEVIKTWLNRGHNTSPMTNMVLPHQDLIPNHVLRSAIQEWLQQHPQS
ncbi:uncharacterized protein LOC144569036 [Carex rostrata]